MSARASRKESPMRADTENIHPSKVMKFRIIDSTLKRGHSLLTLELSQSRKQYFELLKAYQDLEQRS
jgi:hypothetical protein